MTETRSAILVYLENHQYVRWEHIVKELEGYKNFPGVDEEMRELLREKKIEKMFAPDEPPFCSVKLSIKGRLELREMGYKGSCHIREMFEQDSDPVKIAKDYAREDGSKERKMKIWKRITRVLIKTMIGVALGIGIGVIVLGMAAVALAIGGGSAAGTFMVLLFELVVAGAVLHEITEGEMD